jgi:hypothetical protein
MAIQAYRTALASREEFGPGWAAAGRAAPTNVEIISPPHGQYDHAGKNESSWMLYLRPDNSDLGLLRDGDYLFCSNPGYEARLASAEWGEAMCAKTVAGFVEEINARVRGG